MSLHDSDYLEGHSPPVLQGKARDNMTDRREEDLWLLKMTHIHQSPVLTDGLTNGPTAAQIYDDLRPRLLAWPAPVAQGQADEAEPRDMWTVIVGAVIVGILIWACIGWLS